MTIFPVFAISEFNKDFSLLFFTLPDSLSTSRGASAIPIFVRSLTTGFLATVLTNPNSLPRKLLKPLPHCHLRLPFGAALCLYCFLGKFAFGGNSARVTRLNRT